MDILTLSAWADLVRAGATPDGQVRRGLTADRIDAIPDPDAPEARRLRFTVSTSSVDRDRDIVEPAGIHLDNYRKNPVVLWAHGYHELPVARAIDIRVEGAALVADTEFPAPGLHPFADTVYDLVKAGFINATSIGFIPMRYEIDEERHGYNILEAELLEFSIVPVPSNPDALVQARSAGIDVTPVTEWAKTVLTETAGEGVWLPRGVAEAALKIAEATEVISKAALPGAPNPSLPPVSAPVVETPPDPVTKRGRVLSARNEEKLRQSVDLLTLVLAQLTPADEDEPETDANAAPVEAIVTASADPAGPEPAKATDPTPTPVSAPMAATPEPPQTAALTTAPIDLARVLAALPAMAREAVASAMATRQGRLPD